MTQLALFEVPRRDSREITWELAFSRSVEVAVLAVFAARPDEWLDFRDFKKVIEKYKIGCCFGHVLSHISRAGKTVPKNIYFGSDHPGTPNYLGFKTVYMLQKGATA
ncbi:hypothetical protein [Janthinobacterium sp. HLX7-2]|uniref:hypothetical protein n=1 Tax=Janthinobacterium sp. HLX7-2 TaxID=1259331 RepID=UPI003F269D22